MFNLSDPNLSYILFSPENNEDTEITKKSKCEKACSILYSKDYTVISVKGLYNGEYENSFLAFQPSVGDDKLRENLIYLLEIFHQDCGIIKYKQDTKPFKLFNDGQEKPLKMAFYNSDSPNKTYLYDGVSFSFNEELRYYFPTKKEELKTDMVIEYFNNDKWIEKKIQNLDSEFSNLYSLLMKYSRLRIPID